MDKKKNGIMKYNENGFRKYKKMKYQKCIYRTQKNGILKYNRTEKIT